MRLDGIMQETISEVVTVESGRTEAVTPDTVSPRKELDLFVFAMLVRKNIRRILWFAVVGFLVMLVWMLLAKPRYSATAALLVPQNNPSASSLALKMAMGGLDLTGGGFEVYEDILESQTVAARLIAQYHLKDVYKTKSETTAEKILASRTLIKSSKEGMIRFTVEDEDPKRAADMANSYMAELDRLNQGLAITSAGQQRLYFEREMVKEKNALADAEVDLQRSQEQTGLVVPERQLQSNVLAVETTRAQLRARQVVLGALLQGATEENPRVVRLKAEIAGLESQLKAMQNGSGSDLATGIPSSKVPEKSLEYIRKLREVKFHETLFELLAREYENAKQQEAKTVSMIEVLDSAVVPEHKSCPPRTLITMLCFVCGGILGIAFVLVESFVQKVTANPENRRKYREIFGSSVSPSIDKM
jgi:tyrosine-protein kinase Etk/Wzc